MSPLSRLAPQLPIATGVYGNEIRGVAHRIQRSGFRVPDPNRKDLVDVQQQFDRVKGVESQIFREASTWADRLRVNVEMCTQPLTQELEYLFA